MSLLSSFQVQNPNRWTMRDTIFNHFFSFEKYRTNRFTINYVWSSFFIDRIDLLVPRPSSTFFVSINFNFPLIIIIITIMYNQEEEAIKRRSTQKPIYISIEEEEKSISWYNWISNILCKPFRRKWKTDKIHVNEIPPSLVSVTQVPEKLCET